MNVVRLIVMIVQLQPAWLITLIANNLFLTGYYWMDTFKGLGAFVYIDKNSIPGQLCNFLAAVGASVNFQALLSLSKKKFFLRENIIILLNTI